MRRPGKLPRSHDALRARVLLKHYRRVAQRREAPCLRCVPSRLHCVGFASLYPPYEATKRKKKRKRNADRRVQPTSASCDAARVQRHALAYRRSTTALTVRAFGPWAQLQARLPGTRQDVRSGMVAPTGERRSRALTRALPAPACPSPGNAPPGPVVVPVSMMPEAARVRSVSFRARAPHSLHLSEYLRDRCPRSSEFVGSCSSNEDQCQ